RATIRQASRSIIGRTALGTGFRRRFGLAEGAEMPAMAGWRGCVALLDRIPEPLRDGCMADKHATSHGGRNSHSTIDLGSNLACRRIMTLSLCAACPLRALLSAGMWRKS
ncbi:hypothetical protein, partial [Rhodopseudomonas palustris]|uniref:hypothetical protein n=2 Tax=Rhodopseudomonas TaxID=1073 RepID=UPI001AEBD160